LTTGFNAPAVDLIAMLRPTQSTGLYVQIAGRGMRLAPGKSDCVVLDFAGNVSRHGPIDCIKIDDKAAKAKDGDGEAPVKACPECETLALIAAKECPTCGYLYPPPAPKINHTASTLAIMSNGQPEWLPVDDVTYRLHIARSSEKPLLLAVYKCGLTSFHKDYVCLEHEGRARRNAESWWRQRAGTMPPSCVEEALGRVDELRPPREIAITRQGKWLNVSGARF
jgi:DNA repair protein RadD